MTEIVFCILNPLDVLVQNYVTTRYLNTLITIKIKLNQL